MIEPIPFSFTVTLALILRSKCLRKWSIEILVVPWCEVNAFHGRYVLKRDSLFLEVTPRKS